MPELDIPEHTLSSYDEILVGTPERACAGNGSASGVETVKLPQFRTSLGELSIGNTPTAASPSHTQIWCSELGVEIAER